MSSGENKRQTDGLIFLAAAVFTGASGSSDSDLRFVDPFGGMVKGVVLR